MLSLVHFRESVLRLAGWRSKAFKKLRFLLSAVSYSLDHTDVRLDTVGLVGLFHRHLLMIM